MKRKLQAIAFAVLALAAPVASAQMVSPVSPVVPPVLILPPPPPPPPPPVNIEPLPLPACRPCGLTCVEHASGGACVRWEASPGCC